MCTTCPAHCNPISLVPTLSPLTRGTDKDTRPFSFFLFPSSVSRHRALSCCSRKTPSTGRAASTCTCNTRRQPPRATRLAPESPHGFPETPQFFSQKFGLSQCIQSNQNIQAQPDKIRKNRVFLWCLSVWSLADRTRLCPACRAPKRGAIKGDTPMPHRSLLSRAQDSSWHAAHQSPPVDGETCLSHHSHPHAGRLGTTTSPNLRKVIRALTVQQK